MGAACSICRSALAFAFLFLPADPLRDLLEVITHDGQGNCGTECVSIPGGSVEQKSPVSKALPLEDALPSQGTQKSPIVG